MSNVKQNLFAIGRVPNVDYQTALVPTTAPKNYAQVERTNLEPTARIPRFSDNANKSTGSPGATKRYIDGWNADPVFADEDMSAELLARRALAAFGDYTANGAVGTGTAAFKHTFKLLNIFNVSKLPTFSIVEKIGEPALAADVILDQLLPSNTASSFAVSSGDGAFLLGTTNWLGSGKRIRPSGVKFAAPSSNVVLSDELNYNYFRKSTAKLKLYPSAAYAGTAVETLCNFRNHSFSLNNSLVPDTGCATFDITGNPESGEVYGGASVGSQEVQVGYVISVSPEFNTAFNPENKLDTQAEFSSELTYTGKAITGTDQFYKATFRYPKQTVTAVGYGNTNGQQEYQINPSPLSLGISSPVELVIINGIPNMTINS